MTDKERRRKYKELWAYETEGTKACSMCLKIKSVKEFSSKGGSRKGLRASCKRCRQEYANKKYHGGDRDAHTTTWHKLRRREDRDEKVCKKCLVMKPLSEFYKEGPRARKGVQTYCSQCAIIKRKRNYNPQVAREQNLKYKYGMTMEDYKNLSKKQNDRCAICGKRVKLVVDHDHATGKVRSLLCHPCNAGLGYFYDNPDSMRKAADYLEAHNNGK